MGQKIVLNWPRCRDGYEFVVFDSSKVDWQAYYDNCDLDSATIPPPKSATDVERRLLARWGHFLDLEEIYGPVYWVISPKSDRFIKSNVFETCRDLYTQFANVNDDGALLEFVSNYGPIDSGIPVVEEYIEKILKLRKLLNDFQIIKTQAKRNKKLQSELTTKLLKRIQKPDLKLEYEIKGGKLDLVLKPKNLLDAIRAQFLLSIDGLSMTQCESCGGFISISTQTGRADKRFCSNVCRTRNHRAKTTSKTKKK